MRLYLGDPISELCRSNDTTRESEHCSPVVWVGCQRRQVLRITALQYVCGGREGGHPVGREGAVPWGVRVGWHVGVGPHGHEGAVLWGVRVGSREDGVPWGVASPSRRGANERRRWRRSWRRRTALRQRRRR